MSGSQLGLKEALSKQASGATVGYFDCGPY